jgi:hypothetical protein
MLRMLLFLYYIAFAPHTMHLLILAHVYMHIRVDHAEPKSEIRAEKVQMVFGGPQDSSGEDTNVALDQGKPRCI